MMVKPGHSSSHLYMSGFEVRVQPTPWQQGVQVALLDWESEGHFKQQVVSMTLETVEDGVVIQPAFHLGGMRAQQLMDELWVCGFRPSEGFGSAGSLRATEGHLEDMRKIAFQFIDQLGSRK